MSTVYTYNYDTDYDPAVPVVDIGIGRALSEANLVLSALVDSGADATIIPVHYLRQVHARRSRKVWMRGVAGGRILVDLYPISLQLGPLSQEHLEVVGSESDEVIVGRDVLNDLSVTLNGPGFSVQIAE